MTINRREVDFPGDEEQHGLHSAEPLVTPGLAFGGLNEPTQCLKKAIGLAGLHPGNDTAELVYDHRCNLLLGLDLGTQQFAAPLRKYRENVRAMP